MEQPTLQPNGKPQSCALCPLNDSEEGIVWGAGNPDADLMFVGIAPGEEETGPQIRMNMATKQPEQYRILKPFIGGGGKVLHAIAAQAQVDMKKVWLTNVVKCRPTATDNMGRISQRDPSETEIRCCARFLKDEIEKVNPNVIVGLGNVAMKVLTGTTKGIMQVRSVPLEGSRRSDGKADRYKVIGTMHPVGVMRQQEMWPAVVFDIHRARNESTFPDIRRRQWKNIIHAKLADVGDGLRRRIRELKIYYHDLETTGLDPHVSAIRCIGVAAHWDEVFTFDYTQDVVKFVEELHADPTLMCVGQNSEQFDVYFQEEKGFVFNGPTYDTLLGHHLLNAGLPKDLAFIGASSTDEPNWKDDSMYKAGEDALQTGCGKDVHATARGCEDQFIELKQKNQWDLYFNQIMPLQPVLRNMHRRGMKKDLKKAAAWHIILNRRADELEVKLKRGLGDASFQVQSPKQLMDLLYKRMGLPVQYTKTKDGFRPSVDADALDALARISNNPILLLVRSIRTLRKWDATFVMCDHDANAFVHGHFSSAKAANGRLNSFDPNMQNFPVDVREILTADSEDHILIARDWSQVEWRIAMALAGDRVGLDAIAAGRDAHKDAYANAFNSDYETVTKSQRFEAKTYNFGLLYGRGEKSLSEGRPGHPESAIPLERVHDYVTRFYAKFSGYKAFRDRIEQQVLRNHYVETAWGRRRYWYTRGSMPEAYNFPISGTAAHMMYEALVGIEKELKSIGALRLSIHDETVLGVPKEQKALRMAIECQRDVMQQAFTQLTDRSLFPDVVRHYYPNGWFCPTDAHLGRTWRQTKGEWDKFPQDREDEMLLRKQLGVADLFDE